MSKEEAIKRLKEDPLDRERWIEAGKVMGWKDSKYRACELRELYYTRGVRECVGRTGVIVGETRDKNGWYVVWDGIKSRYPYPKEYIIDKGRGDNWKLVWHQFIEHLVEGGDIKGFFEKL